jgi:7-cyano-7-deazaguanine tRNA-ribosyltransferase
VPSALSDTYPLTAELPERVDRATCEAAAEGVRAFVEGHPGTDLTVAHHDWPASALERLPESVGVEDLLDVEAGDR